MTEHWPTAEIEKIAQYDAVQFDDWIREGLKRWHSDETMNAFKPIHNLFSVAEPIEDQLAEMADAIDPDIRLMFLEGLELSLGTLNEEHDLYEALLSVRRKIKKPVKIAVA